MKKKNSFKIALFIIAIIIAIIGIKKTEKSIIKPRKWQKALTSSIKNIYKGYNVNYKSIEKKVCEEGSSDCTGGGFSSYNIDVYVYNMEIKDDRNGEVISGIAYSSGGRIYNTDLVMPLAKHNIEYYLNNTANYKNAKVAVEIVDNSYTRGIYAHLCEFYMTREYEISIYLDVPYDQSSYITLSNVDNEVRNIEKNVIKCENLRKRSENLEMNSYCMAEIDYSIIYSDGVTIKTDVYGDFILGESTIQNKDNH